MSKLEVNAIDSVGSTLTLGDTNATTLALNSSITTLPSTLTNTPAFFVNKTSDQTLTSGTHTKITFDSVVYDTDSGYGSDKFTVPTGKGGKYLISTNLWSDAGAVSNYEYGIVRIYINGTNVTYNIHDIRNNAGHQIYLASQIVVNLSAGDYVEIYCNISDLSGSPFVQGSTSQYHSYFYGYRLIGA